MASTAQQQQTEQAPPSAPQQPAAAPQQGAKPAVPPVQHKPLDQYKVLLHNDDVNDMVHVVQSILEIIPMPKPKAVQVMIEAHHTGAALVTVTHLELAELYRDQFQSKGLSSTIEKA